MITKFREQIASYVVNYISRFPHSEIRDLYKRLFQAFHGSEHSVTNRESAHEWLLREWEEVSDWNTDQIGDVTEAIDIEGVTPPIFLVHLGPAKISGLDPNAILDEFLRTGECFQKNTIAGGVTLHDQFIEVWKEIGTMLPDIGLTDKYKEYPAFSELMKLYGWQAVHHSDLYRNTYNPHYRVIMDPSRLS
jgi:hypothetical protein